MASSIFGKKKRGKNLCVGMITGQLHLHGKAAKPVNIVNCVEVSEKDIAECSSHAFNQTIDDLRKVSRPNSFMTKALNEIFEPRPPKDKSTPSRDASSPLQDVVSEVYTEQQILVSDHTLSPLLYFTCGRLYTVEQQQTLKIWDRNVNASQIVFLIYDDGSQI